MSEETTTLECGCVVVSSNDYVDYGFCSRHISKLGFSWRVLKSDTNKAERVPIKTVIKTCRYNKSED